MAPRKKTEKTFVSSIEELSALATEIGEDLSNPPVSLDRGSYIEGAISFGSLILDLLTGGGLPPGKFTDFYGPEGSGKSTCAGHLIANATRARVPVFFFDHETGSDAKYFRALGVRIHLSNGRRNPYFHYYQPDTSDDTYRTMARILRRLPDYSPTASGGRPLPQVLFVIDSIAAMLAGALEENEDNAQAAITASSHSRYIPLIKAKLGRKNASLFVTNQTRLNPRQMFGSPEYEPGGQAIRFYPDLKVRISAVGKPFVERNRAMRFLNISTKKNKQFPPFLEAKEMLTVAFGRGFERGRDSLGYLTLTGQTSRNGNRRVIELETDTEYEWNHKPYYTSDLMEVLCSNEFRGACRKQLESDLAYSLFFAANDWDSLYDFDEEAAFDKAVPSEISGAFTESSPDEEDASPAPKKRRKRRKRKVKTEETAEAATDSEE